MSSAARHRQLQARHHRLHGPEPGNPGPRRTHGRHQCPHQEDPHQVSGCPNSCGQHHIANIGFHGAAMKVGPQQLPAYHMFVGGSYNNGNLRMATQLKVHLPAKRSPDHRACGEVLRSRPPAWRRIQRLLRPGGRRSLRDRQSKTSPSLVTSPTTTARCSSTRHLELYQLQRGEGECAI